VCVTLVFAGTALTSDLIFSGRLAVIDCLLFPIHRRACRRRIRKHTLRVFDQISSLLLRIPDQSHSLSGLSYHTNIVPLALPSAAACELYQVYEIAEMARCLAVPLCRCHYHHYHPNSDRESLLPSCDKI